MSDRAAAAKAAITAAAGPVFARYGYRRTTMDLIAQAAKVSRPAVYQHFPNKAAVFAAVAEHMTGHLHAAAEAAAAADGTTAERLYRALAVKLDFAAEAISADLRGELVQEAAQIAPETVAAAEARYAALVASVLASDPGLDRLPASDAAAVLVDAMLGIARSAAGAEQMHERLRLLVDLTLNGLRKDRP
ncbi:TetR/AcrR family transcriptional regulator [Glycomyces artemisiae]|uniref:TetR family transcriptional regulator n=1 Tax=Glycomyces artemisiae TaxID=1076443 RepID=A0A2T0UGB5_9ACTN|nr:TetR/AcrR family transcriptional regulator [Glycomyces artemisiae]PRY56857.1 TetR family transcriptional regulator [Glycomyces artemisiae]